MGRRRKQTVPETTLRFIVEDDVMVCYVEVAGRRIAKRYSGKGWISLEPGYTVHGSEPGTDYGIIEIHYDPDTAELQ